MTFYEAVVVAMEQQGIKNFAELCERAGSDPEPIYPSYFSKLKSGHTKSVSWERAVRITRALGITPNDLYEIQVSDQK
jgi:DNA-binding Xre family transcriptional regulator